MRKAIPTTLVLICAFALAVAWRANLRASAARVTLNTLDAERAKLDAALAAARTRQDGEGARGAGPTMNGRGAASPAAAIAAAPDKDKTDTAMSLDKYPGLRALFRRSVVGNLRLQYGAFYRTAKLTPEQIQKFEQAMTEAKETQMDFEMAARSQGLRPSDSSLASLRTEGEAKLKTALNAALGSAGYDQYQQYQRIEPLSGIMGDMTTLAVQHNEPFSAEQADRLMTSIAHACSTYEAGGKVDPLTANWSQVLVEMQPLLSATQFAVVRQEGEMQQVYLLLKQFYAERKSGGT